jgi:hypothetical protein
MSMNCQLIPTYTAMVKKKLNFFCDYGQSPACARKNKVASPKPAINYNYAEHLRQSHARQISRQAADMTRWGMSWWGQWERRRKSFTQDSPVSSYAL